MGERLAGSQKVTGSSPVPSILLPPSVVGGRFVLCPARRSDAESCFCNPGGGLVYCVFGKSGTRSGEDSI